MTRNIVVGHSISTNIQHINYHMGMQIFENGWEHEWNLPTGIRRGGEFHLGKSSRDTLHSVAGVL